MTRLSCALAALSLVACSDGTDPGRLSCDTGPGITGPYTREGQGSLVATMDGSTKGVIFGRATAYQQGALNAAYTVIDGYTVDAQSRPDGELFLFLRSVVAEGETQFVPVTLAQLNDPQFLPSGAIAAYATGKDPSTGDYLNWFVAKSGCIRITESIQPTASTPGSAAAIVAMQGEWRLKSGALVGNGSMSVALSATLLDFRNGAGQPPDSMRATITGVRPGAFAATGLDAFQILHPDQSRLVIVGTQAADTTREIWLSLAGIPDEVDSIPLSSVTLAEARAGRPASSKSFAMVRMLEYPGTTPVVRELWTSTSGYVRIDRVTQNGPLAICGQVSGRFAFSAQGTSVATPGTSLGAIDVSGGTFKTRMTIVAQSDTLVDPATAPPRVRRAFVPAAPSSTMGFGCQ